MELRKDLDFDFFPSRFFMFVRIPLSFTLREFSSVELFVLFLLVFRYLFVSSMRVLDTSFNMVKRVLCSRLRKTLDL